MNLIAAEFGLLFSDCIFYFFCRSAKRVCPWQALSVFTANPKRIVRVFRGPVIGAAFSDDVRQTRHMQLGRKNSVLAVCRDGLAFTLQESMHRYRTLSALVIFPSVLTS